jgi:hypothetical protein
VARWYETMKHAGGGAEGPVGGQIFGDVNHQAGNLVHKIYYWTTVLEEAAGEADTADGAHAAASLRALLGELHGLLGRTLELLRPVNARPMLVPLGDLVTSVRNRLGAGTDADEQTTAALAAFATHQVLIDPLQIDRAFGMLEESFAARAGANSNTDSLLLTIRRAPAADNSVGDACSVEIRCEARFELAPDARNPVAATVGAALACKLLEVIGWRVELVDEPVLRRLTIFVPLVDAASVRNRAHSTDPSEGETSLNA